MTCYFSSNRDVDDIYTALSIRHLADGSRRLDYDDRALDEIGWWCCTLLKMREGMPDATLLCLFGLRLLSVSLKVCIVELPRPVHAAVLHI
eukprot:scaffold296217_cov24-Prasinocladus_malaysianus.AAC.1